MFNRDHALSSVFGTVLIALLAAAPAFATANHAHHHYHMGVRAFAGTRHAATLHYESWGGGMDLALARDDAADMERLAGEILERLERLEAVWTPQEARRINRDVASMKSMCARAAALSRSVVGFIDEATVDGDLVADETLSMRCAGKARELWDLFSGILAAHKRAERVLGIPVPPDPPSR
ncbi:MAG: hypothetical protein QF819_06800 [Gemmatimonadota bacterium]|nr:hypothetical protein [Gemmatimonadota bacterium]MDP6461576.1 hypothetical protein [Gemmatimonadota bacterium]MDP6529179.1 hypothetical protein [Gemmatimonadota bacterium]MDP6802868.1 hypothetical protein [Gemmatimonadota bacterium]MDP7032186.1 hypothetical protein [Gemmatimonadota bacterium]